MLAVRSDGRAKPHRSRLLCGPEWVSPYSVRRAALRRVTRSAPVDFRPSRGVVLLDAHDRAQTADVVDLAARRAERAAGVAASAARHPSGRTPAERSLRRR